MDYKELFTLAADIVSERWQQGSYGVRGHCRCMVGALIEAKEQVVGDVLDEVLMSTLRQATGWKGKFLHDWNDEPGRTQEEVEAALRRAAELVPA